MVHTPVPRRAMTVGEIAMCEALGICRLPAASFDKRFIALMAASARDETPEISERQALMVRLLTHRYRRQIKPEIVALAGERPPAPWSTRTPQPVPPAASSATNCVRGPVTPSQL